MTVEQRFWSKVQKTDLCWQWQGTMSRGYGNFWVGQGKATSAHRFAYELLVGPVPEGLVLDHLCRNKACCNPAHLEPVTRRENVLRGDGPAARAARRSRCAEGHLSDDENTFVNERGWRVCRTCLRERAKAAYHKTKAQRQDSLTEQMNDLVRLAVDEGMYDAADWIKKHFTEAPPIFDGRRKAVCSRGHDLNETRYVSPKGDSYCRVCATDYHRRYMRARRLEAA